MILDNTNQAEDNQLTQLEGLEPDAILKVVERLDTELTEKINLVDELTEQNEQLEARVDELDGVIEGLKEGS